MNRKTSAIALVLLVLTAILLGYVLVNRGDGPVQGVVLSDKAISAAQGFNNTVASPANGVYLILTDEFSKLSEKFKADIPAGKELYAAIHFVECTKGTQFTVKWIAGTETIKEETKELATDKEGVISYSLEGEKAKSGS